MVVANEFVRAIGYLRVSTVEQVDSGAGMDAQRTALRMEATRRGWDLELAVDAGISGSVAPVNRPALAAALQRLDAGDAQVLVVSRLDRLSRSVADFAQLCDRARRRGWQLVAVDVAVDTTTPAGELVSNVIAATSQYERRLIGARTKEALAARKAAGVRLGRPQRLAQEVVDRIVINRGAGLSLRAIAAGLTEDGIATAGGGPWRASTVQGVLRSQAAGGHQPLRS